jgi:hypothetical protein
VLLVLLVMLLAAVVALAAGGRFSHLTHLQLTGTGWLVTAGVAQIVGGRFGGTSYALFLLVSASLVAVFLGANRRQPGVALLAAGFAANALVVLLNGAMPISADALARAGLSSAELVLDPRHEQVGEATRLPWLGDTIPLALPNIGQAVSVGDILIAAGAGLMLYTAMRHPSTVRGLRTENPARSRAAETPPQPDRTRPRPPS